MEDPSIQSLLDQETQQEDTEKPPDCCTKRQLFTRINGGDHSWLFYNILQLNRFDLCVFKSICQNFLGLGKVTQ